MKNVKSLYFLLLLLLAATVETNGQANAAYGDNQVQVDIISGNPVFAIYSGDINQDQFIDGLDFLDLDAGIQAGDFGYLPTDLNGDGFVDGLDFLILDQNIQLGVGIQRPQ